MRLVRVNRQEYQVAVYNNGGPDKSRLNKLVRKCYKIMLSAVPPTILNRHKYTISSSRRSAMDSSGDSNISLLKVNKLNDKINPLDILLLNFCHSIEDIKKLQKQPERLDFLKMKPKEIETILMEMLFIFEKKRLLDLAAFHVEKKRNKKKQLDSCCQRF